MMLDVLFTATLATFSVSLWTVRLAMTARGNRAGSAAVAGVEAMLFVVAFAKILQGLESPILVLAYGAGVAAGTLLGLSLDARLNPQLSRIDVFDPTGEALDAMEASGFPATRSEGLGPRGRVTVGSVVTTEPMVGAVVTLLRSSEATWTVSPVRRAEGGPMPHRRGPRTHLTGSRAGVARVLEADATA